MIPPLSGGTQRSCNDFGRARDARICWLLSTHPVTTAMLVSIGWFPSKNKALKRLRRLALRRRIRLVGTVSRKSGRPEYVYCRWRAKVDQLLHEIELTELCFRLDAGSIRRGPHATDEKILPDAEVWIRGERYYLELDRGTMGLAQIERRFAKYEHCRHVVLWVCPTKERVEGLRQRAERIRGVALFTTFAQAFASSHGEIWWDYSGQRAALPRETERFPQARTNRA